MKLKDMFPSDIPTGSQGKAQAPGTNADRVNPAVNRDGGAAAPPGPQGAQPPAGAPPKVAPGQLEQPATPEEQEQYERVVLAAGEVLYGQTSDSILEFMQAEAENPPVAIARAAHLILTQLDEKSGGTIPETVILPAAMEIAELCGELAASAGLFEVNEDVLQAAGQNAVYLIGDEYGVEPEEMAEFLASLPEDEVMAVGQQQAQIAQRASPQQQGGMPNGQRAG